MKLLPRRPSDATRVGLNGAQACGVLQVRGLAHSGCQRLFEAATDRQAKKHVARLPALLVGRPHVGVLKDNMWHTGGRPIGTFGRHNSSMCVKLRCSVEKVTWRRSILVRASDLSASTTPFRLRTPPLCPTSLLCACSRLSTAALVPFRPAKQVAILVRAHANASTTQALSTAEGAMPNRLKLPIAGTTAQTMNRAAGNAVRDPSPQRNDVATTRAS